MAALEGELKLEDRGAGLKPKEEPDAPGRAPLNVHPELLAIFEEVRARRAIREGGILYTEPPINPPTWWTLNADSPKL
ncbi:MAG: hypothetical protein ACI9QC_000550 [Oceanicoccus sp.]|jgi:hypothetical protein